MHRKQLAGARKTGLHLIGNQQDAMLVAQLAQGTNEFRRRRVEAAFTLHGFKNDCCHPLRIDIRLEQIFNRL